MKKYSLIVMAFMVLFLSGCGGSSNSSFSGNTTSPVVKEVAVLESPVFEQGNEYQIYRGATLSGMDGAKYFVANTGSEANQAALNLGFCDELSNDNLVIVNKSTGRVVFAYDPSGSGSKSSGSVTRSGGTLQKYTSLNVTASSFFTSVNVDTSSAKVIQLNGTSAVYDGSAVKEYSYVWHSDPNHEDEYYTDGIDGIIEYDEDEIEDLMSGDVFIAHDVRYMTNSLDFTAMVADDQEQEYAAYYSESVRASVAAKLSSEFAGPYIFATLPMTAGGMGGNPGGMTPPDMSGDMPGFMSGDTPPSMPSGDFRASASYNDTISSTMALMTHSEEEAYNNPVLHITRAGTYILQGTWNGQIWIDVGEDSADKVALILNGVTVSCDVAPALVFYEVYECGPDDEDEVKAASLDVGANVLDDAGAVVIISDDTVNNFTGSNVYRMLKAKVKNDKVTKMDGTDVSQQKKRYKMDGAFYSFSSMAVVGGSKANGVLNIKSTSYEGVGTEMHMTLESGTVTVYASDDGMNFNEDYVSVFTLMGGNLSVTSTGGDGIDSNGYIVLLGGSLDITCAQDSNQLNAQGDGPMDAECEVYKADSVTYTHQAYSGGSYTPAQPTLPESSDTPITSTDLPASLDIPVSNDIPVTSPDLPISSDLPVTSPDMPISYDLPVTSPDMPISNDVPSNPPSMPSGDRPVPPVPPTGSPDRTPSTPAPMTSPDVTPVNPAPTTSTDNAPVNPVVPQSQDNTPAEAPSVPEQDNSNNSGSQTTNEAPYDAVESETITNSSGTTTINIGLGSSVSFIAEDEEGTNTDRGIKNSDNVFKLTRKVNTFWNIMADN